MQILDHSRAVSCLVIRRAGVDGFHPVTHGVVEQDGDLARRGSYCLGLADARRKPPVECAQGLAATEADLAVIAAAVRRARNPLHGEAEIALKVGAVVNRHKVAKHFELSIGEASFSLHRKTEAIAAEAALDGIYVVRTNLPKKLLDAAATVGAYKGLARVERAF